MLLEDILTIEDEVLKLIIKEDNLNELKKYINIIKDSYIFSDGTTPIISALEFDSWKIFKYLAEFTKNAEVFGSDGLNASHIASKRSNAEALMILYQSGNNLSRITKSESIIAGFNILHIACYYGMIATAKYILNEKLIDSTIHTSKGLSIYDISAEGNKEVDKVQFLKAIGI